MYKQAKKIGINIRKFRKEKKMTLKELGLKVNLSEQAIGQYERGERQPSLNTLYHICSALEINLNDLLETNTEVEKLKKFNKIQELNEEKKLKEIELAKISLFNSIIEYMINNNNYKMPFKFSSTFEITNEDLNVYKALLTTTEIDNIIEKVTDLIEFEIYKIKNSRARN